MARDADPGPQVFSPKTLNEVLNLLAASPEAKIYAGGTAAFQDSIGNFLEMGPVMVSLHQVEEIRKVTHWERSMDLGAALTLNQLVALGKNALNPAFRRAVGMVGTHSLRHLATLGGNLCQKGRGGDLFPVLYTLGAQFEFRSLRSSRWVSGPALTEPRALAPEPGELLTRVRFPLEIWQKNFYERIGHFRTPWDERIAMVCIAKISDDVLHALRLAFFLPQAGIVRDRQMEVELAGQKLPLGPKDRERVLDSIRSALEKLPVIPTAFQKERVAQMARWVLSQLQDE